MAIRTTDLDRSRSQGSIRARVWSAVRSSPVPIALLLALQVGAACGTDASGPDDDVAAGLRVHLNGELVVRADGSTVEGHLHVHVGEYSGQFVVSAVNGAGNTIGPPSSFQLAARIEDQSVGRFVQPSEGALEGEIVATAAGETNLMLELWTGDPGSGTLAYAAPAVEVVGSVCEPATGQAATITSCVAAIGR